MIARKVNSDCKEEQRPLDAGTYELRVTTRLSEPDPDNTARTRERFGAGVLRVQ